MSLSIRQYIKRRVWWCSAAAITGWLVLAVGSAAARDLPDVPQGLAPAVGGFIFLGAILAFNWAVKCPKCKANLSRTIAMTVAYSWGSGPRVNFCPYCGVHLDQAIPGGEPAARAKPQDPIQPA